MGAVFFGVSHQNSKTYQPLSLLDKWIPFIPESTLEWVHLQKNCTVRVWQTHRESARGSYVAWTGNPKISELGFAQGNELCVYTGWVRERNEDSLTDSVATHLLKECQKLNSLSDQPFDLIKVFKRKSGQFAGLYVNPQGQLSGFHDGFCGQHLYIGKRDGEVVFSNRASLIALYLNGGKSIPKPRPESLIWLLSRHESPLGDPHSAWETALLCFPDQGYWAFQGQSYSCSTPFIQRSNRSWDDLYADLVWRAGQVKRLPKVRFSLPLTGGLDSRLIFGVLKETNALSQVDLIWLYGEPEQADVRSAQLVADAYQLPLHVFDSSDSLDTLLTFTNFLTRLPHHLFNVEHMINAWDLKVSPSGFQLPKFGILPGHYGELYRSHALPFLSWHSSLLKGSYQTHLYMNRHHLLTPKALDICIQSGLKWIRSRIKESVPSSHLLDELHREARMWRWASQTQGFEGLGYPSINLLPDLDLRAKFASLPLKERLLPRVHFELTRRVDPKLWTLPYANETWPRSWVKALKLKTTDFQPQSQCEGKGNEVSGQMQMWKHEKKEIIDFLRSPSSSSTFYEYIDQKAIDLKIQKMQKNPRPQGIKGLLGLTAIKVAFETTLQPFPLKRFP